VIKPDGPTAEALRFFNFEHNAAPMWIFDTTTLHFLAVNDAAVRHYGYSRAEFLVSMTALDIRPTEDIALFLREMLGTRHHAKKERWRHRKRSGKVIQVEITGREILFNGRIAEFVTVVDVTGQLSKQAVPIDAPARAAFTGHVSAKKSTRHDGN